jgi:multicomponent Na+:H+ antiporter subunit G
LLAGGVALFAGSLAIALQLLLIWLLVLAASAASAHLISQHALRRGRGQ